MTLPNIPGPITDAYCNRTDLLLGDIPVGSTVNIDAYITSAAEEINIKVGQRWQVPVSPQNIPANYTTIKFFKRMNAQLATGRLLMSLSANIERDKVHAYATRLINEVQAALKSLVAGEIILPSMSLLEGPDFNPAPVLFGNQDAVSGVDAFYAMAMPAGLRNPTQTQPWWW